MRQTEFSTASITATAPTAATRPTAGIGGGSGFGNIFGSVQEEVASFIQNGSGDSFGGNSSSATLSAEGSIWQARAGQAANAIVGDGGEASPDQQAFLESIAPWAKEAADKLGVAPELVSAHAALESGWGQRPLRQGTGTDTNNLFGIKAGGKWQGEVASNLTTEYAAGSGTALKKTERFRSYPDQASAFRDYAQVLLDNPRYRAALNTGADAGAFAQGLARGGYATDPNYAAKLTQLATRLQRTAAAE